MRALLAFVALATVTAGVPELERARDKQDRAALDKLATDLRTAAGKQPNDAAAQYRAALAQSYAAEVAVEVRDKTAAKAAAQAGIELAERAVNLKPDSA